MWTKYTAIQLTDYYQGWFFTNNYQYKLRPKEAILKYLILHYKIDINNSLSSYSNNRSPPNSDNK